MSLLTLAVLSQPNKSGGPSAEAEADFGFVCAQSGRMQSQCKQTVTEWQARCILLALTAKAEALCYTCAA